MKKKLFFFILLIITNLIYGEDSLIYKNNKVGLILSGGGAKGFAHIGLLKVLDEEKIPIDYIVGTSMGSIIGALYSMGYSGVEIEKIILDRDWLNYFNDIITRENELIENKEDKDKYTVFIPIQNWKISIPKGAVKGQNIDKILKELYLNAKDISDFSKLPIPFACVATDAETGNPVVFKNGSLPEAIRASMSLPGLLDPIELDGKLLLDGGLANNFPASIALDMGADYLIGVEVLGELQKKENLKSAVSIMDQAIAYKRVDVTNIEKKKIDILITPNTEKYTIFSFSKAKEIINEGEKAAREKISDLKKLRNEEKFDQIKNNKIENIGEIYIENVEVEGSKRIPSNTVKKIMNVNLPISFTVNDLNKLTDKIYNLNIFSRVTYKILGTTLKIYIEDKSDSELKVGFNYNDSTKGDLFVKFTTNGTNFMGNKMSLEALLGKDDALKLKNTWYIGPTNKFGVSLTTNYSNIENYSLMSNGVSIQNFNVDTFYVDFMIGTFLSNSQLIGAGIKKEYLNIESNTINTYNNLRKYKTDYKLVYLKYIYDSLDNKYFPEKGLYLEGLINNHLGENDNKFNFANYRLKFNKPVKLSKNLTLNIGAEKDYVNIKNVSPIYISTLGGIYSRQNSVTFWGLNPSEYLSNNLFSGFMEVNYQWSPYRYFILRLNQAYLNPSSDYNEKSIFGGGIGIGIKTPIGPVQFILSQSNKQNLMGYLNIGYNF